MAFFERLLLVHRLLPQQIIRLEAELFLTLDELAAAQGKSVQALVVEALRAVVHESQVQTTIESQWESLTARERQVAALTCLGFKNQEIANHLTISVNTVRSHTRSILDKYEVASKAELRFLLATKWEFETWLEAQQAEDSLPTAVSPPGTSPL